MLDEPFLNVVNTRTSLFGHWLMRLQCNVGLCLLLHGKRQLVTEDQKCLKMALSGAEDLEDSFTEKPKYILQL